MLYSLPAPPVGHRTRYFVVLPNGKRCSLAAYVRSWKQLKQLPPETEIQGWECYGVPVAEILLELRRGAEDRLNRRAGLVLPDPQTPARTARLHRRLRARVRHACRWCGQPLGRYAPEWDRFCDAGCRAAFAS